MTRSRTILVHVGRSAIEDGSAPPPRVGEVATFGVRFLERPTTHPDATTVQAWLDPSRHAPVFQYTGPDSPRRWQWQGLLRADGWTAAWHGFTPRTGQVKLTGTLFCDLDDNLSGSVRGRVTRVRLVQERYARMPGLHGVWEPVPGGPRTLTEIDGAPRFFDDALHETMELEADYTGGVLVDLDLDDVPAPPLRPSFRPGPVSVGGDLLWVADTDLPLIVSIGPGNDLVEHLLPGPIGPSHSLAATPTGCWASGTDGTYRCEVGQEPRRVDENPVHAGAAIAESFLTCSPDRWALHHPVREPLELAALEGRIASIAVDGDSFVVAMDHSTHWPGQGSHTRLVRVSIDGRITVGPKIFGGSRTSDPTLTGSPLRLFHGVEAARVRPDLTLETPERLPYKAISIGQAGKHIWYLGHPPDGTGDSGWWPLPGPTEYEPSPKQQWLFTLLDGQSLAPIASTLLHATRPSVTVDDAGTVWAIGDGLQRIPVEPPPPGSMHWPAELDVAALLDAARGETPRATTDDVK